MLKGPDVAFRRKSCQLTDIILIKYFALRVVTVMQSRTQFFNSEDCYEVFGRRNPPCNAEYNLRAEHIVTEDWFWGY